MLRLIVKELDRIPVDAEAIAPDRLAGMPGSEIAAMPIRHGNRELRIADLFEVDGDAGDSCVEIVGDCSSIKGLGSGMASGRLTIHGNAGMHTGAVMSGGRIDVYGDAADWLGAEMRGGAIRVHGNTGDCAGSAYRGGRMGMRGGIILIDGDAGEETGASMRRGLIAVGGRCGGMAGVSMIAGSLLACRGIGPRPGAGMRRGSIIVMDGLVEPPPTFFRHTADYDPAFLRLYFSYLRSEGFPLPAIEPARLFRRYAGDLLALGKGEILVASRGLCQDAKKRMMEGA
jgi:formylmethanofuran dehydrogenase subunit C